MRTMPPDDESLSPDLEVECPCGATFQAPEEGTEVEWTCPVCQESLIPEGEGEPDTTDDDANSSEELWEEDGDEEETFFYAEVGPAFLYPLQGMGPYALFGGWILLLLVVAAMAFAPAFYLLIALPPLIGYVVSLFNLVLERSAAGEPRMPTWADLSPHTSLWESLMESLLVCVAAGAPVGWMPFVFADSNAPDPLIVTLLAAFAIVVFALLFPMCYLSATLINIWSAFAYPHILRSIFVSRMNYGVCFLLSLATLVSLAAGLWLVEASYFFGAMMFALGGLYLTLVLARLLGVFYRVSRRELRWFEQL